MQRVLEDPDKAGELPAPLFLGPRVSLPSPVILSLLARSIASSALKIFFSASCT